MVEHWHYPNEGVENLPYNAAAEATAEFTRVIEQSGLDRDEPGQVDDRPPFSMETSRVLWWRKFREESWGDA